MNENTIKEVYTDFLNKRNVNEKDIVSYECVNHTETLKAILRIINAIVNWEGEKK
jgi:hypothetical protein